MVDLGFAGNPFTWCNNRMGLENIKERLNRVYLLPPGFTFTLNSP
jgi:hypothetical protein